MDRFLHFLSHLHKILAKPPIALTAISPDPDGEMGSTLEAKSLSKAVVPSTLLENPSPGNLQSTRLALHVCVSFFFPYIYTCACVYMHSSHLHEIIHTYLFIYLMLFIFFRILRRWMRMPPLAGFTLHPDATSTDFKYK